MRSAHVRVERSGWTLSRANARRPAVEASGRPLSELSRAPVGAAPQDAARLWRAGIRLHIAASRTFAETATGSVYRTFSRSREGCVCQSSVGEGGDAPAEECSAICNLGFARA